MLALAQEVAGHRPKRERGTSGPGPPERCPAGKNARPMRRRQQQFGCNLELMERAIPILPTEDLATAKAFYVDGLGFRVTFEASADGRAGLLGLARGTIQLTLDSPMNGHGRNACVSLQVDDADAYYHEWSTKVAVLRAPQNEDWGARTFDLQDPSGNTIFVMGPVSAHG